MHLDKFVPFGGRPASGRDGRRFERFAEVGENLPDRPRFRDEGDQPDVAAARRALERKLLPHPRHQLGPGNPGGVVRAGLLVRIATASRGVLVAPMAAGRGIALLADVADRQSRDGRPQRVIGSEDAVIAMPVPPRLWNEIRKPVEELKRRELDDAIGPRLRGLSLSAWPDPAGGLVPGHHVTDFGCAAACVADHGEPLECKRGPGTVPQEMLERLT